MVVIGLSIHRFGGWEINCSLSKESESTKVLFNLKPIQAILLHEIFKQLQILSKKTGTNTKNSEKFLLTRTF